jgi:type IV pilus assembly protein PilC
MGRIGLKPIASFCKQTSVSIRSGLTFNRAFPIITKESGSRQLRNTINKVGLDLEQGNTLGEAMRKHASSFPPIFVEMVQAGERSGHLEEVFSRLADYFDRRVKLRRAVIKACIYPMIQLTTLMGVVCLFLMLYSSDRRAMAITIVTVSITVIAAMFAVFFFFSRTGIGRAIKDRVALVIPIIRSLTIKLAMGRFVRTLAMQIESGVPIGESIESSAQVAGNGAITRSLRRIVDPIEKGESLVESIRHSSYLTPMIREVLAVGEETGNFGESLERVADIYEDESLAVLESLPKFIGPIVVLIVGLCVLYLFYTVYIVRILKPMLEGAGV